MKSKRPRILIIKDDDALLDIEKEMHDAFETAEAQKEDLLRRAEVISKERSAAKSKFWKAVYEVNPDMEDSVWNYHLSDDNELIFIEDTDSKEKKARSELMMDMLDDVLLGGMKRN